MKLERIPVRYRLALAHSVWLILLFAGLGTGIFFMVESNLNESTDYTLEAQANLMREARFGRGNYSYFLHKFFSDPINVEEMFGRRFIRTHGRMISASGKVSYRTKDFSVNLPVTPIALKRAELGKQTFETFKFKNMTPIRVITIPIFVAGSFTGDLIQVGTSLESTQQALRGVAMVLWISFPIGVAFSVLFGYFLTKRSLNPVRVMTNTAQGLSIQDLGVRIPLPVAKDELRELAETFNSMMDRLEDSVKRLRRFTGDVSHELRTPLAVLRAEAEFALRKERSADQYKESVEIIAKEAVHMGSITEDLLLLARAESMSVAMSWQKFCLESFVKGIIHDTEPDFLARNIALQVKLAPEINEIEASDTYLSLALRNIVANAAKHSESGGVVKFDVNMSASPGGVKGIEFDVSDTGEGIPEKDLPHIFDPFYRADTARNRGTGGAGIGLSLAMALVKLHGGDLTVNSNGKTGTTFKVFIPQTGHASD